MKKILLLFIAALIIAAACSRRVPLYAPRRHNTQEHRGAMETADCLRCHDVVKKKRHSESDNCISCHRLCEGC